jgi:Zn-dependent peptidase ImmA (M78 family)
MDYVDFMPLDLPQVYFEPDELDEYEEIRVIEKIADTVRSEWHLGRDPINDLRYTLESKGIVVTCASLNASKIDAFSQMTVINGNETYFVVISKDGQTLARARFDMAHELGHILLHSWGEGSDEIDHDEFKRRERQANIFASSLLLPRDSFGNDVRIYPNDLENYKRLKRKWNVSIQAMVYRARQLDIITANQFQYLMKRISQNGWRTHEPGDTAYVPKSTLLQSAVELLLSSEEFTVMGFLTTLRSCGIVLKPSELEDLLCLKRGTLKIDETPPDKLVRLKFPSDGNK